MLLRKLLVGIFILLPSFGKNIAASELSPLFSMTLEELLNVKVSGASLIEQNIKSTPARVLVFDRKMLDNMLLKDLSDLMQRIPSIDVIDNNHRFGELYTVRGITGNDRFLVLLNGKKINSQTGFLLSIGNSISLEMADSIEVIYGPSSVVHGTDGFSVAINIITKPDNLVDSIKIGAARGSYANQDIWLDAISSRQQDQWMRFYARSFTSDGFEFDGPEYREAIARYPAPFKQEFEQPIIDYNLLFEWQWEQMTGGFYRQAFDEGNGRGLGQGEGPFLTILNKQNHFKFTNDLYWINWAASQDDPNYNLEFIYQDFALDSDAKFFEFTDESYIQATPFYKTGRDQSIKLKGKYRWQPTDKLDILLGAEWQRITSIPPYANDVVFGTPTIPHNSTTDSLIETTRIWESKSAIFTEFDFQLNDKLSTTLSARYDQSNQSDNTLNPRMALAYQFNHTTNIKLIYSSAFQSPSLDLVNEQWGNEFFIMVPNTEQNFMLKNQQIDNIELSFLHQVNDQLLFSGAIYSSKTKDLINYKFQESIFNRFANEFTQGMRFENLGSQKTKGVDLSLTNQSGAVTYYVHYSYVDAEEFEQDNSQTLPLISKHKIWGGLAYQFNDYSVSLDGKWISDPTTLPSNPLYPGDEKGPGYTQFNVSLRSNLLANHWLWYLKIENLFNSNIKHIGFRDTGTAVIPQPGINGMLGIEYQF